MTGTVTHYNRLKAYGFIVSTDDANLPDFFVIPKFIQGPKSRRYLVPGQTVEFDPADVDTDRPQAHNVRIVPVTITRQTGETTAGVAS